MVPHEFDYFVCTVIKQDRCLTWATHSLQQNVSLFFGKRTKKGNRMFKRGLIIEIMSLIFSFDGGGVVVSTAVPQNYRQVPGTST